MLGHLGRDRRDLPDLDADWLPLAGQGGIQRERTTRALDRPVLDLSRDPVGAELDPGVAVMALLSAPFAPRRLALEVGPRTRRVARRRAGGVAGVLMGARLEVGNLPLELGDRRLQRRHLIAEERDLALQERDVGLGYRREGGPHLSA
jgi:hypothetical protein